MIRHLPLKIEDDELRTELTLLNLPFRDLRLVKNRETGQSRGFAFVEFDAVEDAQRWMETTNVKFYPLALNPFISN